VFPCIRLGPFLLQLPGLALLGGVWVGSSLAEKEANRLKLDVAAVYNLIFYGLVAGTGAALVGGITNGVIYWQRTRRRPR
jgi:prolipoprotein diacylglyceryltransferase